MTDPDVHDDWPVHGSEIPDPPGSQRKEHTMKLATAALVRAIRTVAQTAVGLIGSGVLITDVSWEVVVSGSALAGVLSLLTSVAGLPEATD